MRPFFSWLSCIASILAAFAGFVFQLSTSDFNGFYGKTGWPLPYESSTDYGPPFDHWHVVGLIVDSIVTVGFALLIALLCELALRRITRWKTGA